MAYADEQSYEEVVSALQSFLAQAEEQCMALEQAGADCIDNMDEDPVAGKAAARVNQCVGEIRARFETIQAIARALQQEIDNIRETAAGANFDD